MTVIHKAAMSSGDGMNFVLSDATVDSYGDVVDPDGWDLRQFKRNPIALFGHSSGFPIGKWSDVRVEGGKLLGRLEFAQEGTSPRIDELRKLVDQGILRAVSVGFRPIKSEPINPEKPYGAQRYLKQELLETSLVSIPANPAALALARGMDISDDTMAMAFGEHADRAVIRTTGEQAVIKAKGKLIAAATPRRTMKMTTLSKRIEDAQANLNLKRDRLVELTAADELDTDAVEALTEEVEEIERGLNALKSAEKKIGVAAVGAASPAIARRPLGFAQKDVKPLDLIVRAAVVNGISMFTGKEIDRVLDDRYPGSEATAIVARADQTIGTTGVAGWAAELMQTSYQGFTDALRGRSIYPELRARSMSLNFDSSKTAYVPGLTAGGANGGFFSEGSPMRVGRITTNSFTMTRRKMGVIVPFSREAAEQSTPSLENLVREAILGDTAAILDSALLDATASSTIRPAGLLNGVAAVATGYGGGDHVAVMADFKALLTPFNNANASDNIVVIMNPAQGLAIDFMIGPDGALGDWFARARARFTFIESTYATAGRLIAVRVPDLVTAMGDAPRFEMSNTATIHMEDATPLEIVSATPTVADPVRSFFQTDTLGIRMVMDVAWAMRRAGMVQWIDGTSW